MRFPYTFFHWALVIGHGAFVAGALALAQPEEPKPATLRFLFLDETAGHYTLKLGADYRQISANPYEISAPFSPSDLKPLDIYKTNPIPDPLTGQTARIKIASLTPPADTTTALVIVTPRPPSEPGVTPVYRVELIDSNPAAFPPGSIRIINRGQTVMAAQFGNDRVTVSPGDTRVVQPATDTRNRVFSRIAAQTSSGWKFLSDNITIIRPRERLIGLFVYSPGGLRHTLTASEIKEFGPPPPGHFWLTCSDSP